jgi:hypothetical protein
MRPCPPGWEKVEDFWSFKKWIIENGLPDEISFDHDLGGPDNPLGEGPLNGLDCAKFLVSYCTLNGKDLPKWSVHSANPVGKENIISFLKSFENGCHKE